MKIPINKNNKEIYSIEKEKKKVRPYFEALKLAAIYIISGILWILISDIVSSGWIKDIDHFKNIQLIKGWIYVTLTGLLIYYLIVTRMKKYKKLLEKSYKGYEELKVAHKGVLKIEEEMRINYEELERHRNALAISEERYRLAVEGASEGIWDLDLINGIYFFSIKFKKTFGYSQNELGNTYETWYSLLHPHDKEKAIKKLEEYKTAGEGVYENTYRLRCKDGSYRWILSRGQAIWDDNGMAVRIAGSHTDITERKIMEEKLYYLAYHDTLTGLPNKLKLSEAFKKNQAQNSKMAVLYLDIDNFKHINDTLGHDSGDKLIKYIADILKQYVRFPNMTTRLSGDEFAILYTNIEDIKDVEYRINSFLNLIRRSWVLQKHEFFVSVSIGIAIYPEHGNDLAELLKNADSAMFCAKEQGKDGYYFYTKSIEEKNIYHVNMLMQLRNAIDKEQFILYYQPLVELRTGKIIGLEALIRWRHPDRGFVSPSEFIPIVESTGQIVPISKWVLKTVYKQQKEWKNKGYLPIKISVNLSSKRLLQNELINDIVNIFPQKEDLRHIQFEITETSVMSDIDQAINVLNRLKELGIKIALDDFGTGYSSLTYLKKLPIDILKMDKKFIDGITDRNEDKYIVKSVIELAHNIHLEVVAEGIETQKQLSFLKEQNCDIGQGFFICKPLPAEKIENILKNNNVKEDI